jgi:toxin ParE1/3/4
VQEYNILIIDEAEKDILDIYHYIANNQSIESANYVLTQLESHCNSLALLPERGYFPPELTRLDMQMYREIHFKPYRIIYEIIKNNVYIHCVLDGRRDLEDLLRHRLLRN